MRDGREGFANGRATILLSEHFQKLCCWVAPDCDSIMWPRTCLPESRFVKKSLSFLLLMLAPAILAAPLQSTPPGEPPTQTGDTNVHPQTNQATSHDRHMRRHRAGSHHK